MSSNEKKINTNPIQEEEERKVADLLDKKKMMSVISVHCIKGYTTTQTQDKHQEIISVRDYCNEHFITFSSRFYDSYNYGIDRDEITELPAFYIYINNNHITTVYQKAKLARSIEKEMFEIEKKWKEKKKRDKELKERKEKLRSMLTPNIKITFGNIFTTQKKLVNMKPYEKK